MELYSLSYLLSCTLHIECAALAPYTRPSKCESVFQRLAFYRFVTTQVNALPSFSYA
jgi:hypothetical protein